MRYTDGLLQLPKPSVANKALENALPNQQAAAKGKLGRVAAVHPTRSSALRSPALAPLSGWQRQHYLNRSLASLLHFLAEMRP